ncbi:MAG: hypothetical protein A3G31_07365 [Candidatus Schekmanbacteria bacterium RIFCSPLOWO2_12_FULL_38_15]|uniref:Metallo-beta-lactamase domain-containing protein n=1 Tax=Candidatus Schekmanbacteria bacterium RIFCSPLOWO2_12_FULL_38_15 TaxID=1817883 RepID=A0A1F7SIC7_9BACT|nr:MAG: hypothetical protein A3G31_07365 [Candidatus Schekmanbacteria bacterium RIFCSPLOWO2_12_FULL_38_15]
MYFKQIPLGQMGNYSYLFGCEKTKEAAVVDPAFEVDRIIKAANSDGYKIKYIFTTHGHFDHTGGHIETASKTGAKIIAHKKETGSLKRNSITVDIEVNDGDEINVGNITVKIIHTPGHTKGGICLLVDDKKLITGDTLFVGDCGRTDLGDGSSKELFNSINEKLKTLPDNIEVYSGHGYGGAYSTIGQEKKTNPAMKCKTLEEFEALP